MQLNAYIKPFTEFLLRKINSIMESITNNSLSHFTWMSSLLINAAKPQLTINFLYVNILRLEYDNILKSIAEMSSPSMKYRQH